MIPLSYNDPSSHQVYIDWYKGRPKSKEQQARQKLHADKRGVKTGPRLALGEGIKPDRQCLACLVIHPANSGGITKHHLVPRADPRLNI